MGKNIIICCDGTGNEIAGFPTNVLRLFHTLERNDRQLCYYDGGVGTLIDPTSMTWFRKWLRRNLDGAIGHSLRNNFCHAYQFLARHYIPGDKIYMFGFSRGAYTVRALAGAIHAFGILRPELHGLTEYVWSSYADELKRLSPQERFEAAARFKKYFAVERETSIQLLGVFDTVSSVGWVWDYRTLPFTANNPSVQHIRHAMAIDERRANFQINRFGDDKVELPRSRKEVWFPGVHSDIGGGYKDNEAGLAKVALQWMIREAEALGVEVNPQLKNVALGETGKYSKPDPLGQMHVSLRGLWNWLELFPHRTWSGEKSRMQWRVPNFWRVRRTGGGQCVHRSVLTRFAGIAAYRPNVLQHYDSIED